MEKSKGGLKRLTLQDVLLSQKEKIRLLESALSKLLFKLNPILDDDAFVENLADNMKISELNLVDEILDNNEYIDHLIVLAESANDKLLLNDIGKE